MAAIMRTPGITGSPGKCPWKKGSLTVTFFIPAIRLPSSSSMMRSTNKKGYRWGKTSIIPCTSIINFLLSILSLLFLCHCCFFERLYPLAQTVQLLLQLRKPDEYGGNLQKLPVGGGGGAGGALVG